jgi:hypothetical protein
MRAVPLSCSWRCGADAATADFFISLLPGVFAMAQAIQYYDR